VEDIRLSLRTHALNYTAITDLISQRFHVDQLPENITMPCIRMKTVTDTPMNNRGSTGIGHIVFQLECYSEDTIAASQLAQALRDIYDGYSGAIGNFKARVLIQDVPGNWQPNERLFIRMIEMDIGYVG